MLLLGLFQYLWSVSKSRFFLWAKIHPFASFIFRGKETYVILLLCADLCIYPWKYFNSEDSFYQNWQRGKSSKILTSDMLGGGAEDKSNRGDISHLCLHCSEVHCLLDVKTKKQIHRKSWLCSHEGSFCHQQKRTNFLHCGAGAVTI